VLQASTLSLSSKMISAISSLDCLRFECHSQALESRRPCRSSLSPPPIQIKALCNSSHQLGASATKTVIAAEFVFPESTWGLSSAVRSCCFWRKISVRAGDMACPNVMDASRVQFAGKTLLARQTPPLLMQPTDGATRPWFSWIKLKLVGELGAAPVTCVAALIGFRQL